MKITSKEMLLKHIEDHKGKNVPLFTAFNSMGSHFVRNDTIHADSKIEIKQADWDNEKTGYENLIIDGHFHTVLHDRHISGKDQSYNDNWWFTTREEAEAYVSQGRTKHELLEAE